MAGLRYRDISPFTAARKMKLSGVTYNAGDSIPREVVANIKHLDALLSNNYIKAAGTPFTKTGKARHVPTKIRKNLKEAALDDGPEDVPTGTIAEVLAWVGTDAGRAQLALDVENDATTPRTTLVDALEQIIADAEA